MSYLRRHNHKVVVAFVLSLSAVALAACGGSSSSASKSSASVSGAPAAHRTPAAKRKSAAAGAATVNARLTEFKIAPAPATATAGRVVFRVTNAGKIKHQFTVIRTDKPAAKVLGNKAPNDDIPGARGEISSIQPGASKTLVIKHLKAGHYALVCALPGHYQSGMYADFTVR